MRYTKRLLYAYAYNKLNDVYTIRGVEADEMTLEPRSMSHIPVNLIASMRNEYSVITGLEVSNIKPTLSFSNGNFYAIIDFHAREFTPEQVEEIISGRFVNVPYNVALEEKGVQKVRKPRLDNL